MRIKIQYTTGYDRALSYRSASFCAIAYFTYHWNDEGMLTLKKDMLMADGIDRDESFMFTGQEFEQETGLYNYKARMYDQETGRFLQPDPVHTENVGFDNWDRYQYANNNPVNFTDPTGESTNFVHMFNKILKNSFNGFNHAMKNWIHGNNRGMKGLSHKFNSSLKGMIGKFNSGLGAIGHKVDHAVKSPLAVALYTARSAGITDEEFILLYSFASLLGHSATETWFGHNYTGPGNKDPFSKFNNRYSKTSKQIEFFILMKVVLGDRIADEKVLMFLMLIPLLSPELKSFADGLAQRHDRDVPGDMLGFPDQFFSLKFHARHIKADGNYVGGFLKGMFTPSSGFWKTPLDSIVVGGGGSVLFSGDACLRTFCWVPFVL